MDDMEMAVASMDSHNRMAVLEALGMRPDGPPQEPDAAQVRAWTEETDYSEKYCDDVYEYRRVTVPRAMLQVIPQGRCMEEREWRAFGITMSRGWQHYDHHSPEANVLLFRRVLGTDPKTGQIPPDMAAKVARRDNYIAELEHMRQRMLLEKQRRQEVPSADFW